ncbi:hypothetical protein [Pseudomonas sp. AP-1]|uniref:hypothetical protein n=1 Tax=Pseudomonas sp. AP-1 TaxID=3231718 RepID=UPI0035AE6845
MIIEIIGRAMQLGLAVVVVLGLYGWAQEAAEERDELCYLASDHLESTAWERMDRASKDKAEKAYSNACSEPSDYQDF